MGNQPYTAHKQPPQHSFIHSWEQVGWKSFCKDWERLLMIADDWERLLMIEDRISMLISKRACSPTIPWVIRYSSLSEQRAKLIPDQGATNIRIYTRGWKAFSAIFAFFGQRLTRHLNSQHQSYLHCCYQEKWIFPSYNAKLILTLYSFANPITDAYSD